MKRWSRFAKALSNRGGMLFGVCAQSQESCDTLKKEWKLEYDLLSDTTNSIAATWNIFISTEEMFTSKGFKNGMTQPGVIVVNQNRELLYFWRSIPQMSNIFGAKGRPKPADALRAVVDRVDFSRHRSANLLTKSSSDTISAASILRMEEKSKVAFIAALLEDPTTSALIYELLKPRQKQIEKFLKKDKTKSKSFLRLFGGTSNSSKEKKKD